MKCRNDGINFTNRLENEVWKMNFGFCLQSSKKKRKIVEWVNDRLLANLSCNIPLIELTVYHTHVESIRKYVRKNLTLFNGGRMNAR